MHSLKNTVIAVCLLGLSFVFYQASSKNTAENMDLFPAIESAEEAASPGPQVGFPDLPKSVPDSGANTDDFEMPEIKVNALAHGTPPPVHNHLNENSSGLGLTPPPPLKPTPPNSSDPSMDRVARDQGLIDALNSQIQSPNTSGFVAAQPNPGYASKIPQDTIAQPGQLPISTTPPFAANTIPSNGISSNQLSSGTSDRPSEKMIDAVDFTGISYQSAMPKVDEFINNGDLLSLHQMLSQVYVSPDLTGPQRQYLSANLNALAGKVIYSEEHYLTGAPYIVTATDTLKSLAVRWGVTESLIYNINQNQIVNPNMLVAGTPLKAIRGPFRAEIDLVDKKLTLFLGNLYAGSFDIKVGISGRPIPGEFRVMEKSENGHQWLDANMNSYPPGAPQNGYGPHWIGLTEKLCIHAVANSTKDGHHGCIGLNPREAQDVFAMLTKESTVTIVQHLDISSTKSH